MTKFILIAISGGSASGKTTVAKKLAALMGNEAAVLEMDSYYKDLSHLSQKEREAVNFDHPKAMDLALFKKHLKALKSGKTIEKPVYDFHAHKLEERVVRFAAKPVIIAEGLFILMDEFKEEFSYRVFIDTPEEVRLKRRIERDVKERGRDRDSAFKQYHLTVKPMFEEYIAPTKKNADVVVSWENEDLKVLEKIIKCIKEL